MKTKSYTLSLLAILAATTLAAFAGEPLKPYVGSAEFEKLKSLAGTWQGTHDMGQGPMPVTVHYRITSGGSAVEERLFADTPMEMITIYHDKGGKLALTHYCMLCNQPAMTLTKSDGKSITLDLAKDCGIDAAKEKHMHSVTLTFDDADHITHDWTLHDGGKAQPSHPFKLERVKS
jgi:hypothetical protein